MIIHTERLILREPSVCDAEMYMAFRNSEFVLRYNAMKKQSLEQIKAEFSFQDPNGSNLIMEHKATREVIGMVCIHEDSLRWGVRSKELSYFLSEAYACQGYMKEALKAVIEHLFGDEDLDCISARSFAPNEASRKLLRSLGFHQDGILRRCVKGYNDVIYDDVAYSLLKEDRISD